MSDPSLKSYVRQDLDHVHGKKKFFLFYFLFFSNLRTFTHCTGPILWCFEEGEWKGTLSSLLEPKVSLARISVSICAKLGSMFGNWTRGSESAALMMSKETCVILDALPKRSKETLLLFFHLAARPGVRWCEENQQECWRTNVIGTGLLLEEAAKHSCVQHFIFASSTDPVLCTRTLLFLGPKV